MSLIDKIFGRPLRSSEISKEQLTWSTGVTVLGLDALSSTAYGPEAALTILVPLGALGLRYLPFINLALIVLLGLLFFSYRQTIAAYPNGGGAYIVAKENLGQHASLLAAASLLLDYVLNVAVGVSAGVAAVVSAVPILQGHVLMLCVIVLLILTVVNLRGVRESGITFGLPTFAFVVCMSSRSSSVWLGCCRVAAIRNRLRLPHNSRRRPFAERTGNLKDRHVTTHFHSEVGGCDKDATQRQTDLLLAGHAGGQTGVSAHQKSFACSDHRKSSIITMRGISWKTLIPTAQKLNGLAGVTATCALLYCPT